MGDGERRDGRLSTEEILRRVAEGTAITTGEGFFQALTESLASALGLRYCMLTQCLDSPPTRLSTLAFWNGNKFDGPLEYDLAGTPCEDVVAGQACFYPDGIQAHFPKDQDLVDLGAESYAAVPFQGDDGTVIGHLAVLDVDPLPEDSFDISILKIFAARAGAELERQRAVAELQDRRLTLERQVKERTQELEAFAYTVSHQLRSPLVTVGGFATLMTSDYREQLDDRGKSYLARIAEAAERMGAIIDQLLAFSRLRHAGVSRAVVDVGDAVAEAVEQLSGEIDRVEAKVEVATEDDLKVMADRGTLIQSVANLVANAVKYGGKDQPAAVWVDAEAEGHGVRIRVRDNGIGIAAEDHDRIFNAFERTSQANDRQGTGLGLAIVKKAVERMGGSVGVESELGVGSTFWIELAKA